MKLSELRALMHNWPRDIDPADAAASREYVKQLGMEPGELYQELEMESRFADTHRDISFANTNVALHSHSFYELLCCSNTCGAEYLVGAERYRLRKGDIVVIAPGVSHRPLLPETMTEPYSRYVLWLSPEFMEQYAKMFSDAFAGKQASASMLRTAGTKWEYVRDFFRTGVQEAERQDDGWEAAVIGNTVTLLTHIKRATEDRGTKSLKAETPELLDRIMAFVEENYTSQITIRDLGRRYFVSESTVSHLFKQKMGVSFYRYVTQRRLIAAKTLIEKGRLLETVAAEAGFSDYSGFYRAFRQEYGISPRQYRNLQEGNRS